MKKAGLGITIWPRKKKPQVKQQSESIWLGKPREGFTADMSAHFVKVNTEDKMLGVTMQAAKRHGTL